jgi:glycosyltransferase involved in cell wall biosynthesis
MAKPAPGRVMFVSSIVRYGGGERWMCDAASGLQDRGHGVKLVARPGSVLSEKAAALGIDTDTVEMRSYLDPAAIVGLSKHIRRFRPQVICANLDREVRLCAAAIAAAGARGAVRLIPRRGSEFPLKNKFHYRFVYTHLVDRVIANSDATRKTMISRTPWFPPDKAVVIHNGIDIDEYDALAERRRALRQSLRESLGIGGDAKIVTLVGELNERKGQQHIVAAAPDIVNAVPQAHFAFAGDGDARDAIEAQIESSGVDGRVFVLGFRSDVPELLVASDVLVLPSRVEGFGYVLVEAMAARLPVVATNASSIPEIVVDGDTGFLHEVADVEAIAGHIITLLSDEERASAMAVAGYNRAREKFSVPAMLDGVERLFFNTERFC